MKSCVNETFDSRNGVTNTESVADCRFASRNANTTAQEIGVLFGAAPLLAESKGRWQLQNASTKAAALCFKCERAIAPSETICRVRVPNAWGYFKGGGEWAVTCDDCGEVCLSSMSSGFFQAAPCEQCKRPVRNQATGLRIRYVLCSDQCRVNFYRELAAERRRVARASREESTCETCKRPFTKRTDAKHCSAACKQKAYRQRQKEKATRARHRIDRQSKN
jgi:hypothetical protein